MTDIIEYDSEEMFEKRVCDALKKLSESFAPSEWPRIDNLRLSDLPLSDIVGRRLLYNIESYIKSPSVLKYDFCGYYLSESTDHSEPAINMLEEDVDWDCPIGSNHCAAVLKKTEDDGWDYIRVFKNLPRHFKAHTLSVEKTASSTDKILELINEISEGSIVEITNNDGLKIIGFFRGIENGQINVSFGFASDSGCFEGFSDISLYKQYYNDASIHGFRIPDFAVGTCKQFTVLRTSSGLSNIKKKYKQENESVISPVDICNDWMKNAIDKKVDKLVIKFLNRSVRTYQKVQDIHSAAGLYPENYGAPILSRFKILAGLDLSEHEYSQSGEFTYEHEEAEYLMRIGIQYFEGDGYQIEVFFI